MPNTVTSTAADRCATYFKSDADGSQHIDDTLRVLKDTLAPQRRVVHTGEMVHRGGERFGCLYILPVLLG